MVVIFLSKNISPSCPCPHKKKQKKNIISLLLLDVSACKLTKSHYHPLLVGGIPTPLKNMSSSVGIMTFPTEWKNKPCSKPPTSCISRGFPLLCLATRTYHMGISHQTWLENPWNWIWWIVYTMFDDHKMGYHNMGQWKSWYMDMDGLNNYGMWKVMFFFNFG